MKEWENITLEIPVNPSLTLGMIRMCTGAWGFMSLKASTLEIRENQVTLIKTQQEKVKI